MPEKTTLTGNLAFIALPDVFQILGGNNSTGVLRIKNQYTPNPGLIYFVSGDPVNASTGSLHGTEAIYALFGWTEGNFEFDEQQISVGHVVKQGRMELVLEALRMLDDGVIKKVGPPSFDDSIVLETGKGKTSEKRDSKVVKGPALDYSHILEEEDYRDGERLIKEGGHGKWIWVILEGTVNISRETPSGPLTVNRLGQGSFIGTVTSLSFLEYARSASVIADGNVRLGLIDTERLSREYTSLSPEFRALLISVDGRLRQVTDRIVELYLNKTKGKELTKGKKVIMKSGSSKKQAFIITGGETCVVGQSKRGHLPLLTLKRDDVFGHFPFLQTGHEPRSASVLATDNLKVSKLDVDAIQKEYDNLSGTFRNMIFSASGCVFSTTKKAYRLHEKR
jgi:CRP-like cAMP-binding protein